MSSSIIQRSADPFTDVGLPRLYLDPVLNKGSRFLFDFLSPTSNPNPDGALASGATFKNLVDGGADGIFTPVAGGNGAIVVANAPNKAGLTSTGQVANMGIPPIIDAGAPQATADKPFITILWLKMTDMTLFQGANLFSDTVAANGATGTIQWAWSLYCGVKGQVQAGQRLVGGTLMGPSTPTSFAVRQVAMSWEAGMLTVFVNGAVLATQAGVPSPIGATGRNPMINFTVGGTYYRAYMERNDLSGRSALATVQADYALNNGRFA